MSLLRVLIVSALPPPASGIATWSIRILRGLKLFSDVSVFHIDTAVRWRSTNDSFFAKRLCGGSLQALRDFTRTFYSIIKNKPDVIHLCTSGSLGIPKDVLILAASRIMGIKSVLHYHKGDLSEIILKKGVEWALIRLAIKLSNCFLLLDKKSVESLRSVFNHDMVELIPNPIDACYIDNLFSVDKNIEIIRKVPSIVFSGWVVPTKGIRELIEACCGLPETPFTIDVVGNVLEEFQRELKAIASVRDNGTWLKFHGMLDYKSALEVMRGGNCFVLPSYTEGFPNVILEAMVLSKPIIATKVGAIPEMLDGGRGGCCGILVEPRNVDELRSSIRYLLQNPSEAEVLGKQAREKAISQYSINIVVSKYLALWRNIN